VIPAAIILLAYLLGSIPFAVVVPARMGGIDVRRAGSGNVGAANVLRTSGIGVAVAVMLLDIGKGAASVLVAQRWVGGDVTPAAAGLAAILGHVYPVWLWFRGGKGVATACGVFAVLAPVAMLPVAIVFVVTVWTTRFVSLGSVVATVALGPFAYAVHASRAVMIAAFGAASIIVFRHRANLARLRTGTERRLGERVTP